MSAEASDTQAATEAGLAAAAGADDNEGAEILLAMLGLAPQSAQKPVRWPHGRVAGSLSCTPDRRGAVRLAEGA